MAICPFILGTSAQFIGKLRANFQVSFVCIPMKNPFLGAPASATRQKEHSIHATSKVRAILRIRPFLPLEKETESASAIRITGKNSAEIVNLRNASEALTFTFDGCYEPEVSNLALFRSQIKPMLSSLLSGGVIGVYHL